MAALIPEISGSSIVLAGSFNPGIYQPQWFAKQELLSQGEADSADIKVIAQGISHFETEQFTILVTMDRFVAMSNPSSSPAPLKDLVMGTFFILGHTPITAMGLNNHMHFAMRTEERWHEVGDRLAPKDGWKGIIEGRPGLLSMTIQSPLSAVPGALLNVKIETSGQISLGIYFETNEHYPASETTKLKDLMELLGKRWEEANVYSTAVVNHILDWAKNE